MCFVWFVLAALYPQKRNPNRLTFYKQYLSEIKVYGLNFPLHLPEVKKFEKLNTKIFINVFAYNGETCIYPVYVASDGKRKHLSLIS